MNTNLPTAEEIVAKIAARLAALGIPAPARAVRAIFIGGNADNMMETLERLETAGYRSDAESFNDNRFFWAAVGVSVEEYDVLVEASL